MIFEDTYLTIKGWMSSVLELKGNELLAFALIYGFSQDGQTESKSSISYIQKWLNCSRPTAIKTMKSLAEKQYVLKRQITENGDTRNCYRANLNLVSERLKNFTSNQNSGKENLPLTSKKTLPVSSKETLPSIYTNNNSNSNKGKSSDLSEQVFSKVIGLKDKIGPKHYEILNEACEDQNGENYKRLKSMYPDGRFALFTEWLEFKKETGKGLKAKGSITTLVNLFWDHTPKEMQLAIRESKANGYAGIFPKKMSDKQVSQKGAKVKSILSAARRKADVI